MITENKQFENLWNELIPASGNCETLAGELVRAAGRLQYDFYNNGMGNNTSGAINFLRHHGIVDEILYQDVHYYTTGRVYNGRYDGDSLHKAIDKVVEQTTHFVILNPVTMTIENEDDMFNYEDDELSFCESCGDVTDYGWRCEHCEEQEEEEYGY